MAASNIAYPPSNETLNLARKRAREKELEFLSEIEVLEQEIKKNRNQRETLVKPSLESSERGPNRQNIEISRSPQNQISARSSCTFNLMDERGAFLYQVTLTTIIA